MKFAYDLETTGLNVHSCSLLGIAICFAFNVAYYIVFPKEKKKQQHILDLLRPYFEDERIEKVGHNLKYDNQVLKRYGIDVKGALHDTMVADYVLHPQRKKHGLKLLSQLHLNYKQIEFDTVALGTSKNNKTLEGVPPELVKDYACEDVDQTLQLHEFLLPKIQEQGLTNIYKLDCDLVPVLTDMEYYGVAIDTLEVTFIEHDIDDKLKNLKQQISKYIKGKFNINSTKHVNRLLFDELGIEPIGYKNKNGLYSVSSKILKRLVCKQKVVGLILEYRALYKVKSTFIKALKRVDSKTGRLHTSINQMVTVTGRLSSSHPNLQNIPSRTIGKLLRKCFIASASHHKLIGADFKNIEMRVMAIISKDKVMLDAYKNGIDLHTLTASTVFNIPYKEVTKEQRTVAKTINFGLIYGMSAFGLAESLTLNTGTTYTPEQCQQFINQHFELYTGVAKCKEELIYKATINGYTETMFGRRRPLSDINSNDSYKREAAKRLAMNTPIQGTAADIIKMAMVNIHQRIQSEGLHSKMILTVHDELLFDVPIEEVKYMEKLIKYEMENAVRLPIALEVDLKTGNTWADVH